MRTLRALAIGLTLPATVALAVAGVTACSSASAGSGTNASGGTTSAGGAGGGGGLNFGGSAAGGAGGSGGKLSQVPPCPASDPNADGDKDGFTPADGDCNDCTLQMNPGAYDYPGNGIDEDCNGTPDDEPTDCDATAGDVADPNALRAAHAIGICRMQSGKSWGLVSAKYVKADGTDGIHELSHGLLTGFGPNMQPRAGASMLALSSGTARQPTDPGWQDTSGAQMGTASYTPPGFPIDSPSCQGVQTANDTTANDPAALELVVRTPTNANQLSFDFDFYTWEFPGFVCTQYNDFFVALLSPAPPSAQSGNISFDSQGNPVSVNNGYLEVCAPQQAGGKNFDCKLGISPLTGTGFENHAATGWLNTKAPIPGGYEVTLRFAIWDMGDEILDSTVLIDNFSFDVGQGGTPVTQPVPK